MGIGGSLAFANTASAGQVNVYRLYNTYNKEHLYTTDKYEYNHLPKLSKDWKQEGVNFKEYTANTKGTKPVYRVYNPKSGEHLLTADSNEKKTLTSKHGWKDEKVSFYAPIKSSKPVYRVFNAAAGIGAHHMTSDNNERKTLIDKHQWKNEGKAFNVAATGDSTTQVIDKTSVKTKNTTLYIGDTWKSGDNFVSATDKDGKTVGLSSVKVTGNVDTSKAGTYTVTYSYGGETSKATITVKEDQTSLKVKDSTLYVGDSWKFEDNFVSATDKDGKAVSLGSVKVTGNVDTFKAGTYTVTYSYGSKTARATITVKLSKSFTAFPQGDVNKHKNEEARTMTHSDKFPTGMYVDSTEALTITTDKSNVRIIIGQYGTYDYLNNNQDIGFTSYDLEVGENTISFEKGTGMIYIQNLSENDSAEVTIKGGLEVPTFLVNETTTEEWKEQMNRLSDAPFVELVGDYVFGTFQYNQAKDFLNPNTVNERVTYWDQVFLYQNGIIGTTIEGTGINKKYNNRVHIMNADTGAGWANASNGRLSFHKDSGAGKSILQDSIETNQWGGWHEMGHTYQNPYYKASFLGEVTVNIPALIIQNKLGLPNRFVEGDGNTTRIKEYVEKTGEKDYYNPGDEYTNDNCHWIRLGLFEQLRRAYGNEFYSHLNYNYRLLDNVLVPSDDEGKFQLFMKMTSKTAQRNFSEFFEKWGLYPNEDTLKEMEKYSKPQQAIWENIYNGTIVDEEFPELKVPQANTQVKDYILGSPLELLNVKDYLYNIKDSEGEPADEEMESQWNIQNPASKGQILNVKIKDSTGMENKFFIETNFQYGNALSMNAYGLQERAIITLQKSSQTIESFSDETRKTQLESGEGEYVHFSLYDNQMKLKKESSANREDTPFAFVKSISGISYENGDYIKMTVDAAQKLELYTQSEISMKRSDSTREEWFKIVNDTFERIDYTPRATTVEVSTTIGKEVNPESLVKNITDTFDAEAVKVSYDKQPNLNKSGNVPVSIILKNKMGYQTKLQSTIHVGHGNALSLRAYLQSDERTIIRLDKSSQTLDVFANPDRQTELNGSAQTIWQFTLYDGKTDAVKKEASALGTDLPFDFANELNGVSYEEGDYIKIYNERSDYTFNYRNDVLTDDVFSKEEYLTIHNDQFIKRAFY